MLAVPGKLRVVGSQSSVVSRLRLGARDSFFEPVAESDDVAMIDVALVDHVARGCRLSNGDQHSHQVLEENDHEIQSAP
jgi:hypothetical protein